MQAIVLLRKLGERSSDTHGLEDHVSHRALLSSSNAVRSSLRVPFSLQCFRRCTQRSRRDPGSVTMPSASYCTSRKFKSTNGLRPTGSSDRYQQSPAASVTYPPLQMTTVWSSTDSLPTSRRIQVSFWASAQRAAVAEERTRRHRLRDGRWHPEVSLQGLRVFLWVRSGPLIPTVLRFMSHIALFFGFSNSRNCGMWRLPHRYAHSGGRCLFVPSALKLVHGFRDHWPRLCRRIRAAGVGEFTFADGECNRWLVLTSYRRSQDRGG